MDRIQYFKNELQNYLYDQSNLSMNITIIFVRSGYVGGPYTPLEDTIITHLEKMVRKVIVADPQENVAAIAKTERPDLVLAFTGLNFPTAQVQAIRQGFGADPRWRSQNQIEICRSSTEFSRYRKRKEINVHTQHPVAPKLPSPAYMQPIAHNQMEGRIKTAVWFVDDPYSTDITSGIAPCYDYIFTIESSCVPFYRSLGCKHVYWMPLAADPQFFYPKLVDPFYETDILFIGSAYRNRVSFFDEISEYLLGKNFLLSGWWWDRLSKYQQMKNRIRLGKWMTPQETSSYYNGAKIVINLHRSDQDESYNKNWRNIPAHSVNPRTFEIAGCGTLQLSDARENLKDVYEPESEVITFHSPKDFIEKAEYYIQNEQERHEVSLRSLDRTAKEHIYEKRLSQLLSCVFSNDSA